MLDRDEPLPGAVVAYVKLARRVGEVGRALELCDRLLGDEGTSDDVRTELLFRKAAVLDGEGRHEDAWAALTAANDRVDQPFDPRSYALAVERTIETWPREAVAAIPSPSTHGDRVVLVLGMPRSGTSLVEQILGSHPAVYAGGELPEMTRVMRELDPSWGFGRPGPGAASLDKRTINKLSSKLTRRYRALAPKAERVTDKTLTSYEVLGLLAALLPGVRVINCVRDPLDTCLSCYFQYFEGAVPFVYDLAHLGSAYTGYQRLMAHWKDVLDTPILDVQYEELVADQEAQTRRLLDFAGLPWDDRCMRYWETDRVTITASAEQVRRPIYAGSVARHKPYEHHLGPLKDTLGRP